jgi:hypothetical protein
MMPCYPRRPIPETAGGRCAGRGPTASKLPHSTDPSCQSRRRRRTAEPGGAGQPNAGGDGCGMNDAAQMLTVRVPLAVRKQRGGRKPVLMPAGMAPRGASPADTTLVKALARAFRWRRMLETGVASTVPDQHDGNDSEDPARVFGVTRRFVQNCTLTGLTGPHGSAEPPRRRVFAGKHPWQTPWAAAARNSPAKDPTDFVQFPA